MKLTGLHNRLAALILLVAAGNSGAQQLIFGNKREIAIPDYATLRIGPFYSTASFSQRVGYRWTQSSGTGTDFLYRNNRGYIKKDGSDFPIISTLNFRNYLLITRHMDMDLSVSLSYEYYPMDTQDNNFRVDMANEGVLGTLSMEYRITPVLSGRAYDRFVYTTDYIDTRGLDDRYGGEEYEHIENTLGTGLDWYLAKDKRLGLVLERQDVVVFSDPFKDQEAFTYREGLVYEHRIYPNIFAGAAMDFFQTDYKVDDRYDTDRKSFYVFLRYNEGDQQGVRIRVTDITSARVGIGYSVGGTIRKGRTEQILHGATNYYDVASENNDSEGGKLTGFASLTTYMRENLYHTFSYYRELRSGFNTSFETSDNYRYDLHWNGYATKLNFYSEYSLVYPSGSFYHDYTYWITGLKIDYPLMQFITLHTYGRYAQTRYTGDVIDETVLEPEDRSDYDTLTAGVGTTFDLTKTIDWTTYYAYVERISDDPELEYTRNIFETYLTYTYKF